MSKEINLLPIERRQHLDREAWLDGLRVGMKNLLLVMLLLTVVGGVSLAGVTSLAAQERRQQGVEVEQLVAEFRTLREEIALNNELLQLMAEETEGGVLWSERVQELVDSLPPGVKLSRLEGTDQPPLRQLVFSGTAITRNSLIVLERRMQELDWIERVEAPVSNLINRTNPEFIFTVRINPPEALSP